MTPDEGMRLAHRFADLAKLVMGQEKTVRDAKIDLENMREELGRIRNLLGEMVGRNICRKLIAVPSGILVLVEYVTEGRIDIHVFDPDGNEIQI